MGKVRMKQSVAGHKLKQLEEDLAADLAEPKEKDSGRMECGIAYAGTEISFGDTCGTSPASASPSCCTARSC